MFCATFVYVRVCMYEGYAPYSLVVPPERKGRASQRANERLVDCSTVLYYKGRDRSVMNGLWTRDVFAVVMVLYVLEAQKSCDDDVLEFGLRGGREI